MIFSARFKIFFFILKIFIDLAVQDLSFELLQVQHEACVI